MQAPAESSGTGGSGGSGGVGAGQLHVHGEKTPGDLNDSTDLYGVDAPADGGIAYVPCCAGSTTVTILVEGNLPTSSL